MRTPESTLLLPVPALDQVVGQWRADLDPAAADGIPAHITVSYPWLPPTDIDDSAVGAVAELTSRVQPFSTTFRRTGWFGADVLWLAPDPSAPVVDLARAVLNRWPQCPPYGNAEWAKVDIVPHLTVGHGDEEALREAEREVAAHLPATAVVDELWLMEGVVGQQWRLRRRFTLGRA